MQIFESVKGSLSIKTSKRKTPNYGYLWVISSNKEYLKPRRRERAAERFRERHDRKGRNADDGHALAADALQLAVVFRAVIITYYRSHAYRVTDKYGVKYKLYVHYRAVSRHPVFAQKLQKLIVKKHSYHRGRNVGKQVRRTVGSGVKNRLEF